MLQGVVGGLCLAFAALVVGANRDCAPTYFRRADVTALLALALMFALALLWASAADGDLERTVGVTASAGAAALMLSTISIPALFAPLAIAGCLRLPRSHVDRWVLIAAVPLTIIVTIGLPLIGQGSTPAGEWVRCP